jgi:hypothetical protein
MGERLLTRLQAVEEQLRRLGATRTLDGLRPGITPEQIAAALTPAGLTTPPGLVTLYGWHDGTVSHEPLFPGHVLLSLEEALAARTRPGCPPTWLPIFGETLRGGGYAIDCGDEDPGRILLHDGYTYRRGPAFPDLATMFDVLADCYEDHVFFLGGRTREDYDDSRLELHWKPFLERHVPPWSNES